MRRCKVLKEVEALTRITGRSGYALVYVGENRVNEKGDAPGEMKPMAVLDVLAKLAEYESTGFEPKEIRARIFSAERMAERAKKVSKVMNIVGFMDAIATGRGVTISEELARRAAEAADTLAGLMEEEMG